MIEIRHRAMRTSVSRSAYFRVPTGPEGQSQQRFRKSKKTPLKGVCGRPPFGSGRPPETEALVLRRKVQKPTGKRNIGSRCSTSIDSAVLDPRLLPSGSL
jgi:hypothetical protein